MQNPPIVNLLNTRDQARKVWHHFYAECSAAADEVQVWNLKWTVALIAAVVLAALGQPAFFVPALCAIALTWPARTEALIRERHLKSCADALRARHFPLQDHDLLIPLPTRPGNA